MRGFPDESRLQWQKGKTISWVDRQQDVRIERFAVISLVRLNNSTQKRQDAATAMLICMHTSVRALAPIIIVSFENCVIEYWLATPKRQNVVNDPSILKISIFDLQAEVVHTQDRHL